MIFRGDEQGFIIGVNDKPCFALVRLFDKFSLAIVNRDFIAVTPIRIISAKLGGI